MNIKTATQILKRHNKWRRGDEKIMQVEPTRLGIAIDTVLAKLKNHGDIGDVMILPSPNDKKRERIAYLKGVLKYNIWADAVPNGNEKCDAYEKELEELTGES